MKLDVARGMDCGRIVVSTDAESSSSSAQVPPGDKAGEVAYQPMIR